MTKSLRGRPLRQAAWLVALLALLTGPVAAAADWHGDHEAEVHCAVCHAGHQVSHLAASPAVVIVRTIGFVTAAPGAAPVAPTARRSSPARAPPA